MLLHSSDLDVLQTSPLTITDGLHSTETSPTPVCLNDLRARHPDRIVAVGTTWTVKKYTIRYTSHGPPRKKLRIILDAIDCVDVRQGKLLPTAEALNRSNEIASTLQLIHNARVQDDVRCLRSQPKEEEELDSGGHTMAGADERINEDASMNTQMPFGTQMQHPIRSRRSEDDVAFLGTNRLEPVLAGNTQRAELKPRSGTTTDAQRAQLLSLLGKTKVHQPASPQSSVRPHAHAKPEPRKFREPAATASPRPRGTPSKRANRERTAELVAQASQTPQDKGKKRMREEDTESPSVHSSKKTSFSEDQPKRSYGSEDRFAAECSWMKGLTFNRATATVPEDQANLLNNSESWAKQSRFPPINIPIALFTIFSRTVDEKAALEGATSSGSFHETQSSASYPANSAPQPEEAQDSESEDEAPTSEISWQTSPSPQPPQRPALPRQGLPPDSSLEMPESIAETAKRQRPAASREQLPPSTLPASSHEDEGELPPSSPPAPPAAVDSDDDDNLEMETSVPQALGEDLSQRTSRLTPHIVSLTDTRSKFVIQVEETPYVKGENGQQPVVTICPPTQESTSHSSSASIVNTTYYPSSSVVEETSLGAFRKGTDAAPAGDMSAELQTEIQDAQIIPDNDHQDMSMFDMFVHDDPLPEPVAKDASERQARKPLSEMPQGVQGQPEPTPMSAQLPPKDSSSGEQPPHASTQTAMAAPLRAERRPSRQLSDTPSLSKRKHVASPTLDLRRGSKTKRPKYAFGSKDPQTLIRERQESLRVERQKSTASAESTQGSVSDATGQRDPDTKMEDSDAREPAKSPIVRANASAADAMSPRHRSLYASPSPDRRPVKAPPVADPAIESIDLHQAQPRQGGVLTDQTTEKSTSAEPAAAKEAETASRSEKVPEARQEHQPEPAAAPAPVSTTRSAPVPRPSPASSRSKREGSVGAKQAITPAPDKSEASLTVFERFQIAYPEYNGNSKHFANQCKMIDELDREDRMVPKWMWDDFIVRNRTDYARYALDCVELGEEPMKYIRFYKDTIRDAVYKEGIIETRTALEKALQELGVQALATEGPVPGERAAHKLDERPSRPTAHLKTDARQARRESAQQSPRESIQSSSRRTTPRQTHSPMPPPHQPAITPPRKKSRKSLPFAVPSSATSSRVNGTAHVRHSLPASSSRTAPMSTAAQTASTRPAFSTQQKSKSSFGDSLRFYKSLPSASPLESGTGDEYRDFLKAQEALTATTGSKRVSTIPAPRPHKSGERASDKRKS